MRLTTMNARIDKSGKHNDRNFNISDADHIDSTKISQNRYYTYNGDTTNTFAHIEKDFYKQHFSAHLNAQNARNVAAGHRKRNKTVSQYHSADYTRPEDRILQVGDINKHASPEELWECALEYAKRFDEIFGDYCKILTMAMHVDEATPHVHIRRVWLAKDKDGNECVSQTKALENYGYKNDYKKNKNSKIAFTKTDRQLFYEICKEKGLDVEIANPQKRQHLSVSEYKDAMAELKELERSIGILKEEKDGLEKQSEELSKKNNDMCDDMYNMALQILQNSQYAYDKHLKEIEAANKKNKVEKALAMWDIVSKEFQTVFNGKKGKDLHEAYAREVKKQEMKNMENFIQEKGLTKEYQRYLNRGVTNLSME